MLKIWENQKYFDESVIQVSGGCKLVIAVKSEYNPNPLKVHLYRASNVGVPTVAACNACALTVDVVLRSKFYIMHTPSCRPGRGGGGGYDRIT